MAELSNEIERLLLEMGQTQQELAGMYQAKRQAIREANASAVDRETEREQRLIHELEAQLRGRHQILQQAAASGTPVDSLEALVHSLPQAERERLLDRIEQVRRLTDGNR